MTIEATLAAWPSAPPANVSLVRVQPNVQRIRPLEPRRYAFLTWSVADGRSGRVVAHMPSLTLSNVRFVVRASGRDEAIRTGVKNVHAWCVGTYCPLGVAERSRSVPRGELAAVTYRPAADKPAAFWFAATGEAIDPGRVFAVALLDAHGRMMVAL